MMLLRALRRLRGTPFDPFGRSEVRKVERALIEEYRGMVLRALSSADPDTAAEIAALPDLVRGYESIKLRNVERFRERDRSEVPGDCDLGWHCGDAPRALRPWR